MFVTGCFGNIKQVNFLALFQLNDGLFIGTGFDFPTLPPASFDGPFDDHGFHGKDFNGKGITNRLGDLGFVGLNIDHKRKSSPAGIKHRSFGQNRTD